MPIDPTLLAPARITQQDLPEHLWILDNLTVPRELVTNISAARNDQLSTMYPKRIIYSIHVTLSEGTEISMLDGSQFLKHNFPEVFDQVIAGNA